MDACEEQVARIVIELDRNVGERLGSVDGGEPNLAAPTDCRNDILYRESHA